MWPLALMLSHAFLPYSYATLVWMAIYPDGEPTVCITRISIEESIPFPRRRLAYNSRNNRFGSVSDYAQFEILYPTPLELGSHAG